MKNDRLTDIEVKEQIEAIERATLGEEKYNANYEGGRIFDLNSFYLQFSTMEDEGYYRKIVKELGRENELLKERESQLIKSQTYAEFYRTIDETVEECGVSLNQLKKILSEQKYWFKKSRESVIKNHTLAEHCAWQDKLRENPNEDDKMYLTSLEEEKKLLLRVYLALREKGYARSDLIR